MPSSYSYVTKSDSVNRYNYWAYYEPILLNLSNLRTQTYDFIPHFSILPGSTFKVCVDNPKGYYNVTVYFVQQNTSVETKTIEEYGHTYTFTYYGIASGGKPAGTIEVTQSYYNIYYLEVDAFTTDSYALIRHYTSSGETVDPTYSIPTTVQVGSSGESLEATVPVMSMDECFRNISEMISSPTIPSTVTDMIRCFSGCTSLAGNITVNNNPLQYADIFNGVVNDIYIINGAGTTAVENKWKTIASSAPTVHYEADDNPPPSITNFTAIRVDNDGSTVSSPAGTWAYVTATINIYNTIPIGWSNAIKSMILTDGITSLSPIWYPSTITNYPVNVHCWVDIHTMTSHSLSLTVADTITDNGTEKASHSSVATFTLPKAYALIDYYHDSTSGAEGVAIGKYAEQANLLDIEMDTNITGDLDVNGGLNLQANSFIDFRSVFDIFYPVGSYYETSLPSAVPSGESTPTDTDLANLGVTWFNPKYAWGGTWVLEAEGIVHVSAGTNYTVNHANDNNGVGTQDGGATAHNHSTGDFKLQTSHIPAHTHGNKSLTGWATYRKWNTSGHLFAGRSGIITSVNTDDSGTGYPVQPLTGSTPKLDKLTIDASHTHDSVGGGNTHNHGDTGDGSNMQPHINVNRWHRTA